MRGVGFAFALLLPAAAFAAPSVELVSLEVRVHQTLIDNESLAIWQQRVDDAIEQANLMLQGAHGDFDTPCCVRLEIAGGAIQPFDESDAAPPAANLLVLDEDSDYDSLDTISNGWRAFVVDSLTFCGGPAPGSIGCADTPFCGSIPGDLVLVVTKDSFDSGLFASTLAHERGHNACLEHVSVNLCQLMRPSAGGACLDAGECTSFRAAAATGGDTCACHDDSLGVLADGTGCTDGAITGICSGGACGEVGSDASVGLVAAGGVGGVMGVVTDERLSVSGLTGHWTNQGGFDTTLAPDGLAYAPDRDDLFGVASNDLYTIDPDTGAATLVGTVSGVNDLRSLAFDPGPTSATADDRLLGVDRTAGGFDDLYAIDPDDATGTLLGGMQFSFSGGFTGLAYDAQSDVLYTMGDLGAGGIFTVDLSTCDPSFFTLCGLTAAAPDLPVRGDPGLAWSADTGRLYLAGWQNQTSTLYDVVDPNDNFSFGEPFGVDAYTVGGLAALPVTEPAHVLLGLGALVTVGALARRRG